MSQASTPTTDSQTIAVNLRINGQAYGLEIDPRATLIETLRIQVGLTGTKLVCGQGACGACTVLVDGERVTACIVLTAMCDGRDITTIEGLTAPDGTPHPLQTAFVKHDALQCGFCTPGQIMSAVAFLREQAHPTLDDIRFGMAGNLCRCAAYLGIRDAIAEAAESLTSKGGAA